MSPMLTKVVSDKQRFPRVSGDEPLYLTMDDNALAFSPRERG